MDNEMRDPEEMLPDRVPEREMVVQNELTVDAVVAQLDKIKQAIAKVMVKDVDYGVIPGCDKPSLLQSGAEKLCTMFRLSPTYTVTKEWQPERKREWEKKGKDGKVYRQGTAIGFIRYEVNCILKHAPTGMEIAGGVGVCNNFEPKFISRDPFEVEETVLQFARKRALVNATRTGTAASAIFTQDMEDQEPDVETRPSKRQPVKGAGGLGYRCPKCGAPLRKINGKKGEFYACTQWNGGKGCRYTANVEEVEGDTGEPEDVEPDDHADTVANDDKQTETGDDMPFKQGSDPNSLFPPGFTPDTVLTSGKHKGMKVRECSDAYWEKIIEHPMPKNQMHWKEIASAELIRRKATGEHVQLTPEPPAEPPPQVDVEKLKEGTEQVCPHCMSKNISLKTKALGFATCNDCSKFFKINLAK